MSVYVHVCACVGVFMYRVCMCVNVHVCVHVLVCVYVLGVCVL